MLVNTHIVPCKTTGTQTVKTECNFFYGWAQSGAQGVSGANNYRTHQVIKMDLTPAEASLVGPAPTASSETSSPVEGTRTLNEHIHQLLSKGVQFPQAMADDILVKDRVSQSEVKRNRERMKHG